VHNEKRGAASLKPPPNAYRLAEARMKSVGDACFSLLFAGSMSLFRGGAALRAGCRSCDISGQPSYAASSVCRKRPTPSRCNACKECMMLIDGKVDYACTVRLKEGVTTLAPLPKKVLIRDLVTEIAPPDERLKPSSSSISHERAIS
jgi:hypothetical protein